MEDLLKKYENIIKPFIYELYETDKCWSNDEIIIKRKCQYKIKIINFGKKCGTLYCQIEIKEYDIHKCKYILKGITDLVYE